MLKPTLEVGCNFSSLWIDGSQLETPLLGFIDIQQLSIFLHDLVSIGAGPYLTLLQVCDSLSAVTAVLVDSSKGPFQFMVSSCLRLNPVIYL